jgi:hypothetical protein
VFTIFKENIMFFTDDNVERPIHSQDGEVEVKDKVMSENSCTLSHLTQG